MEHKSHQKRPAISGDIAGLAGSLIFQDGIRFSGRIF